MNLIFLSFIAGVLTVLAPCSLSLLPLIVGGSARNSSRYTPLLITAGLAFSVFIFTILLRVTTLFISIPDVFWQVLAGGILVLFGIFSVYPSLWDTISMNTGLANRSTKLLDATAQKDEKWYNQMMLGACLGPVFSSCSPTFAILIAVVITENIWFGLLNIIAYIIGLSIVLIAIGYGGQTVVKKLKWAANPHGVFKRVIGLLFMATGLIIMFGLHKTFEEWVLMNGYLDTLLNFEYDFLETLDL